MTLFFVGLGFRVQGSAMQTQSSAASTVAASRSVADAHRHPRQWETSRIYPDPPSSLDCGKGVPTSLNPKELLRDEPQLLVMPLGLEKRRGVTLP